MLIQHPRSGQRSKYATHDGATIFSGVAFTRGPHPAESSALRYAGMTALGQKCPNTNRSLGSRCSTEINGRGRSNGGATLAAQADLLKVS